MSMPLTSFSERIKAQRWLWWAAFVTLAGLGLRIALAWAMRFPAGSGDFSIIGLMAKHMAEGTDFPVFAYGVAYMGSLEPLLAAGLAKLLHSEVTAFLVNLSPALTGTLLLPLLYLFGRDAGSRRAGVLAMLFCLVGSDTLFYNAVAPRGGYMNLMVCGVLTLWLACRIATRERRGEAAPWRDYLVMGFAAGIAWWVTQLAAVFFLAAGLVLLWALRVRLLIRGLTASLPAFLLGSLPWWLWNATHHWGSLDFGGPATRIPLREGLAHFHVMFLRALELGPCDSWIGYLRLSLAIALAACFAGALLVDLLSRRHSGTILFRAAAPLLLLCMLLLYSTSSFSRLNTTRYLLPVFPAVALILALGSDWLLQRFRLPWGLLALVLVIPPHILLLPRLFDGVPAARAQWELADRLGHETLGLCDGAFAGDLLTTHWLNFASREQVCVASLPLERYAPYARRVELSNRRAYLNNFGNLDAFIAGTAGSRRQLTLETLRVDYDLAPPSAAWAYLQPVGIVSEGTLDSPACLNRLTNSLLDTAWSADLAPGRSASLTFRFDHPRALCGIRLQSLRDAFPWKVSLEGRATAADPWAPLLPPTGATLFFWSGPRVMIDGLHYFQEYRFTSPAGGLGELRLVMHAPEDTHERVRLSEVLLMESSPSPPQETAAAIVDQSITLLEQAQVKHFSAPRWLAEDIMQKAPGRFTTRLPGLFSRTIQEMVAADSRRPIMLALSAPQGLLLDTRDVPRSREVLKAAALSWQERPCGNLTLMVVAAAQPGAPSNSVYWTEQGCFGRDLAKDAAKRLHDEARGNPAGAMERLRAALAAYPDYYPARVDLVARLREEGMTGEARAQDLILEATARPAQPALIHYANGVTFLGLRTVSPTPRLEVRSGHSFPLTYYWRCAPTVTPGNWAVFVHFKSKGNRFQDDHVLLGATLPETVEHQCFDEIFTEPRRVEIPAGLPPGDYEVSLGLLDRQSGKRVPASTSLSCHRQATTLPLVISVPH